MQYYLYIADQATGPFEEAEVLRSLRANEIDPDAQAQLVGGDGEWFPVSRLLGGTVAPPAAPVVPPPASLAKAPAAEPEDEDRAPVLRAIRAGTCYGVLRLLIDFFFFVKIAAALAGAIFLIWQGRQDQSARAVFYYFGAGGGFFLILVVSLALRQWLTLFVDVADTLIAQHARHGRR